MARPSRVRGDNLPGDVIVQGTNPGGSRRVLSPVRRLMRLPNMQRATRPRQFRNRRLDWDLLGEFAVCAAWKWGDSSMVGQFHVAEGGNRRDWLKTLFPNDVFEVCHAQTGLIPGGYEIGDDVMVPCTLYDRHPLDLFFGLNDKDKVQAYQNFELKSNNGDHFPATSELVKAFERHNIDVVHAHGRCSHRTDPNSTMSAHYMLRYFTDARGEVTTAGRKLVSDTLSVITDVYKRPPGNPNAIIDFAALNYKFMTALCEVIRDSGYSLADIRRGLKWACEEFEETASFIVNNPENKGGGGGGAKSTIKMYLINLIGEYLTAQ
jgi:hypothetical protein